MTKKKGRRKIIGMRDFIEIFQEDFTMRDRVYRFMQGRYGVDSFSKAQLVAVVILMVLGMFIRPLNMAAFLLILYTYFRILSRNIPKRYEENQKWCNFMAKIMARKSKLARRWSERGMYRYFKCPECRQKVRVPAGHGKIAITCPRCRGTFVRKTGRKRG